MLSALTIAPHSGHHRSTCFFLHGLGDSGHGWADVALVLAKRLPFTKFILPHAPVQKVTMNGGMKMPAWYDFYGLSHDSPQDNPGILQSASAVLKLVDEEVTKTGLNKTKVMIGGFSQGGAIALTAGLLHRMLNGNGSTDSTGEDFAGIMALSTYLPIQEHFKSHAQSLAHSTPLLMLHGTEDGVVSHRWGRDSFKALKGELQCTAAEFKSIEGLAHSLTPVEIDMMAEFMQKHLSD